MEIQAEIAAGVPYIVTLNTAPSGGNANELYRQDLLSFSPTRATARMSGTARISGTVGVQ